MALGAVFGQNPICLNLKNISPKISFFSKQSDAKVARLPYYPNPVFDGVIFD